MAETLTSFEYILTSKILEALGDCTIGHPTMISNLIRETMSKYNVKIVEPIDEDKLAGLAEDYYLTLPEDGGADYGAIMKDVIKAYKIGYHKAKEE